MDQRYEINLIAMKIELLKLLAQSSHATEIRKYLIEQALETYKKAQSLDNYEAAERLLKFASLEAAKLREKNTSQLVIACRKEFETAKKSFSPTAASKETLKNNPDDPDANLAIGRYLCFIKANWKEGLNYLAKGSDEKLAELAALEIKNPANEESQIALADGWWDQAQIEKDIAKTYLLLHSNQWYTKPLPTISGLVKLKVEKRLIKIREICGSSEISIKVASSQASNTSANGELPKIINGELRLDRLHGPYKLAGEVIVLAGGKLLFEQGSIVLCSPNAKLLVQGEMGSYGKSDEFVTFRREVPDKSWDTIAFVQKNNRIIFERFDISGAEIGISVDKSPLEVRYSIFRQNGQGAKICYRREAMHGFNNCLFDNNIKNGVQVELSAVNINQCTITNNGEAGVFMPYYSSTFIKQSEISGNEIGFKSPGEGSELEIDSCNIIKNRVPINANAKLKFKCKIIYWGTI